MEIATKRLRKIELDLFISHYYRQMVSTHGLANAKRIVSGVKKKLLAESKRRKGLK